MARDFPKTTAVAMRIGINTYSPLFSGASKLAFACWAYADTFNTGAADNRLWTNLINNSIGGTFLMVDGSLTPKVLRITGRSNDTETSETAWATSEFTTGTWHHCGGVIDIGGDIITVYMDGVEEASNAVTFTNTTYTVSGSPATTNADNIGGSYEGGAATSLLWDGRIAEFAIWKDTVPSAADFAAMAKGYSPLMFAPNGLIDYFPLIGKKSPETSLISTRIGTITGSIPAAAHPRVYLPGGIFVPPIGPTAAASLIKTINSLARASIKTVNGLAIASVKTINGVTNV